MGRYGEEGWVEWHCVYLFTALKVATLCPLVRPVNLCYRQGRVLGTEGGKVVGIGWFDCWVKKEGASWG